MLGVGFVFFLQSKAKSQPYWQEWKNTHSGQFCSRVWRNLTNNWQKRMLQIMLFHFKCQYEQSRPRITSKWRKHRCECHYFVPGTSGSLFLTCHEQGQDEWQKCILHHEPNISCFRWYRTSQTCRSVYCFMSQTFPVLHWHRTNKMAAAWVNQIQSKKSASEE